MDRQDTPSGLAYNSGLHSHVKVNAKDARPMLPVCSWLGWDDPAQLSPLRPRPEFAVSGDCSDSRVTALESSAFQRDESHIAGLDRALVLQPFVPGAHVALWVLRLLTIRLLVFFPGVLSLISSRRAKTSEAVLPQAWEGR